jgi:predicted MFS family arabinose efflux permease
MLASNFWGGLSDITGKLKPMILVGIAGYVAAMAGIPLFHSGVSILFFVGAAALFYGCLAPLLKAYSTLVMPDRPQHAIAYVLMAQSAGWLVGGLEGGRLMEAGIGRGLHEALWITAAFIAVHLILTAAFLRDRPRVPPPPRRPTGWAAGLAEDLAALYENPRLLRLCVFAFFQYAGNFVLWGFFSVYFVEHLGAGVRLLRYTLAASAITGIVMYVFVGPLVKRFGAAIILALAAMVYGAMYLCMGLMPSRPATAIIFALPLYGLANVSVNTLAAQYSSSSQRGGGLGILNGTFALSTIAGPTLAGALADAWGLRVIPWVAFGFLVAAIPLGWWIFLRDATGGPVQAGLPAAAGSPIQESGRIAD